MSTNKTIGELAEEHGTTEEVWSGDDARRFGHLQKPKPKNNASTLQASKDREYWCSECHHRVTVGTDAEEYGYGDLPEYGHAATCEHHLEAGR